MNTAVVVFVSHPLVAATLVAALHVAATRRGIGTAVRRGDGHQMLCASRSISGAAAMSASSAAGVNPLESAWLICSIRAVR
jgi:hypothetical protein